MLFVYFKLEELKKINKPNHDKPKKVMTSTKVLPIEVKLEETEDKYKKKKYLKLNN